VSAWIKIEKALESDPRVLRIARHLNSCNAPALHGVTLIVGALARLWIYADSHIREDDTIDLGPAEIDEWLGLPGFCAMLPADWLEIIDDFRVKLPRFQQHNGVEAKRRALTQKRVAQHRDNVKRGSVTPRNDRALPDQDQTKTKTKTEKNPDLSGETPDRDVVDRVFDHWRTTHGHPNARLDDRRRRVIRTALRAYTEADLCESITGYLASPHHMGQNDRGTRYDAIDLFLRDAKHIDAGIAFARNPPRAGVSAITRANADATADWMPPEARRAG
jgi:hypothetical protein